MININIIIRDVINLNIQDSSILSFMIGYLAGIYPRDASLMQYIIFLVVYEIVLYIAYKILKWVYSLKSRVTLNVYYLTGFIMGIILRKGRNIKKVSIH